MDKRILIGAGVGLGILAAVVVAVLATRGPEGPVTRTPAVQRTRAADAPAVKPRVTTRKPAVSSGSRATKTSKPRTRSTTTRTTAPNPGSPLIRDK
jgi:hypothetical protein